MKWYRPWVSNGLETGVQGAEPEEDAGNDAVSLSLLT